MKCSVQSVLLLAYCALLIVVLSACSSTYYGAMEKVGVHKRDILVDRVEAGRDSQAKAQQQFKSALAQFDSIVKLEETDLKKAYDKLEKEYEKSVKAADDVSKRIGKIESVAKALFKEWAVELRDYQNKDYRRSSEKQLRDTKANYEKMLATMKTAEKSMEPVLQIFHDNVLFLKHNLNAQVIGSLKEEFSSLELQIGNLVESMNTAIDSSNEFIAKIKT